MPHRDADIEAQPASRPPPPDPVGGHPRLAPGRNSLTREQVRANQRSRLIAATARALRDGPIWDLRMKTIAELARVSRKTLYELFDNKQSCLVASAEEARRQLLEGLGQIAEEPDGQLGLEAIIDSVLGAAASDPELATVLVVHGPSIDDGRVYEEAVLDLAAALGGGEPSVAPEAEFLAGGVLATLAVAARRGGLEDSEALRERLCRSVIGTTGLPGR